MSQQLFFFVFEANFLPFFQLSPSFSSIMVVSMGSKWFPCALWAWTMTPPEAMATAVPEFPVLLAFSVGR